MENCRRILVLSLILLSMLTITTHASSTKYEVEVVNTVSVGDIQISISENDRGIQVVVPNQTINKFIRINNIAKPAWIRIKLEYEGPCGLSGLNDSSIEVSSSDWEKQGDYYYYTQPVESGGYIDFCNSITIPKDWNSSYSGKSFDLIITADAVQKKNFNPDFGSLDPWFGTVIETSLYSKYDSSVDTSSQSFQVVFEDGTHGLVRTGDDFFSNFGDMMPGDSVTDTVKIANNYSKSIEIFFRTDTVSDSKLLTLMQLEIKLENTLLYKGSLNSESLRDGISLGRYINGSSGNLTYTLSMPSNAGNEYAQESTKVKWVFSTSLSTGETTTLGGEDSGGDSISPTSSTEKVTESSTKEGITVSEEELIKIPDELMDMLKDIDDNRLKAYLDKEYLTEQEWQEFISLLETLGIPLNEWESYMQYIPKMGDDPKAQIYLLLMFVSLIALVILSIKKRKCDKQ